MKKPRPDRNEGGTYEFPHGVPRPDRDKWLWKKGDLQIVKRAQASPRGNRSRS